MSQKALSGPQYLARGFQLLRLPGIRLFVALPLAINTLIFGLLSYFAVGRFSHWINQLIDWLPDWLGFLEWLLWPLAVILLLAIVMYLFSTIANIVAAPFNGLLAEKLEEILSGEEVSGRETFVSALASFPRSMGRECQKLLYYALFAILTLIASFIISPLAPILWFCMNAWMMAIEYADYPMDNHKLSFKEARRRLEKQRFTSFGFGAVVMVGTMIPIVNLIIMPAAVCGGTVMWLERLKQQ
ncbi:sulfate transporter CysZ [Spongiibacter sp. KMU-166]|uniref:Sulfate transporter CysZ n=1 Tax=Spongiibacter thalassae TaxID=2721624 RepID=A0ABX1GKD5_9GAMM|nr:sulfate transporter CysZ [Spongiibacter thalassae]NKI18938.1 sulfate transporter CysZ [Spongiibacter thalassae]